jgi:hypothetical protein
MHLLRQGAASAGHRPDPYLGRANRQAHLALVGAQDTSHVDAHLAEAVPTDAFSLPSSEALSGDDTLPAARSATGEVWLRRVATRILLASPPHCMATPERSGA